MTSRVAPTEEAALGARGWAAEPLTDGNVGGRSPRFRRDSCDRYMSLTELLMYTMLWHDAVPPLGNLVASVAKNAPSILMGERLAAYRLRLIGWSSSREKPQARKLSNDHRADCAPGLPGVRLLGLRKRPLSGSRIGERCTRRPPWLLLSYHEENSSIVETT